ncbi:MAG: hypothetical protein R2787_12530 [Saprospiraceae bacterium]
MDRLWFHQCIHGLLSLSTSALRDIHAFAIEHPYQQNIRMAEAALEKNEALPDQNIAGAFQLPDRRALYELKRTGPELRIAADIDITTPGRPEAASVAVSVSDDAPMDPSSHRLRRMLPVYIRPEPDTTLEEEDQEDNWAQLEQLLREDTQDELTEDEPVMASGGSGSSDDTPPQPSLLERLDLRIDDHAFGRPEVAEPLPQRSFTDWLTGLSTPSEDRLNQDSGSDDAEDDGVKRKKKSKKSRKEAKRLAKQSVKRKKVVATQTLAELLAKQGHIADAIDMFERLCLIYPEKKAIFAARIETIKSSLP